MVIIFVRLVRCATGAGEGQDAAEGEDLEESGPGPGSVAAAESLFLCSAGSWLCPLIVTLGLGDFFFEVEVFLGREFRRHLDMS